MSEAMMALAPSHQTTVANNVVPMSQQSEKLLDSSDTDQLEKIIIWDDISLLESLLNEVDDSHWPPGPGNTQNEFTGNNLSCELPMECDFDVWSALNNGVIPAPAKANQTEADYAHNVGPPVIEISINSPPNEYTCDQDINSMYGYFQNYSGLPQQSVGVCGKQMQLQKNDVNNSFLAAATGNYSDQMSNMNDLPMWPQSPNYLL